MQDNKFLPIILGSDENAYGTARQFSEVEGAARPLLLCTRQLNPTKDSSLFDIKVIKDLDSESVFADALLSVLKEKSAGYPAGMVVVPCSDYYTGLICKSYDRLEGLVKNRFNSEALLETFDTKDRFYALCEKYGLDYPKTVVCGPDERLSAIDSLPFSFPIVVKPENSNASEYLHCKFEGVKKVYFFSGREEYLDIAQKLNTAGYKGKLIIQEFIPGGDDAMRVLNSYSGNDGKVRAMCLGQPVLEFYDPASIGNYAAIVSRHDSAICEKMKAFLEEIGYVGFSNFDMKYDSRSGRCVLFEINPRLGRSSFFCVSAGINMMQKLADDVIYCKDQPCEVADKTVLWSHVPRIVLKRYITNKELKKEVLALKPNYTLLWDGDKNIKRSLRIARYAVGQYRSFKRHFFNKEEQ